MPSRPPSPCSYDGWPRCPHLVYDDSGRCAAHQRPPWRNSRRRETLPSNWSTIRKRVLRAHRHRCYRCGAPANIVDHIVNVASGGTDALTNLAPICTDCDRTKSAAEGAAGRHPKTAAPPT